MQVMLRLLATTAAWLPNETAQERRCQHRNGLEASATVALPFRRILLSP